MFGESTAYSCSPVDEKGVVRDGHGPATAWFTDPAGNVIAVLSTG